MALFGYGMPTVAAWENDAATIHNPMLLSDGHTTAQAEFEFGSVGTSITDFFTLAPSLLGSPEWVFGALVIRNITGLKAGTKIVAHFGAHTATIRTVATDRGEISAYWILPSNDQFTGFDTLQLEIYYNDVNGTFDQFASPLFIGEIWFGQTASFPLALSYNQTYLNNGKVRYASGGQQWALRARNIRQVGVDITPQTLTETLNNTTTIDGIDINTLIERMDQSRTLFIAPFYSIDFNGGKITPAKQILMAQSLADTAFLGHMPTNPQITSLEKYFKIHFDFAETL